MVDSRFEEGSDELAIPAPSATELVSDLLDMDQLALRAGARIVTTVDEAIRWLDSEPSIAIDLETFGLGERDGLSPWKGWIAVIAMYGPISNTCAVLHSPSGYYDPKLFRWLESRTTDDQMREYLTHNGANFDIFFLKNAGMDTTKVKWFDTLISEQASLSSGRKFVSVALGKVSERRLGKSVKTKVNHRDWGNPFLTAAQMEYVTGDIKYLHDIREEQRKKCAGDSRVRATKVEMRLLPVTVKMTTHGTPIDMVQLDRYLVKQRLDAHDAKLKICAVFGDDINLNSPVQIKKAFNRIGYDVPDTKKETIVDISQEYPGTPLGDLCKAMTTYRYANQRIKMFSETWQQENISYSSEFACRMVHPRFRQLGTDTGRLSCNTPNFQQVPKDMRWVFGNVPNHSLVSVDYCLHPDTLVETPLHGSVPISMLRPGDWVYSHRDDRIAVSKVVRSTSVQPLHSKRIVLDSGDVVIASNDHRWPMHPGITRKGEHIRADATKRTEELIPGERLIPFRRGNKGRYAGLYAYSAFKAVYEHDLVAEACHGPKLPGHEVHHKNENHRDNQPSNLEYRERGKHRREHTEKRFQDPEYRAQNKVQLRGALDQRTRSYKGTSNPNTGFPGRTGFCLTCGKPVSHLPYGGMRKFCNNECKTVAHQQGINHKIAAIDDAGVQPMWAIEVEGDHNYVLSCGVVTNNSAIEVRVAAALANDEAMIAALGLADIHTFVASNVFQKPEKDITPEERKIAKAATFTLLFAGSAPTMRQYAKVNGGSKISLEEARAVVVMFFKLFPGLKAMRQSAYEIAERGSPVALTLPTGIRRVLVGVQLTPQRYLNTLVQGTAAAFMKYALIECDKTPYGDGMLSDLLCATVHDEIVAMVPIGEEEIVQELIRSTMIAAAYRTLGHTRVPIAAEGDFGPTWFGSKTPPDFSEYDSLRAPSPVLAVGA